MTVLATMLAAVTLLPALLGLVGRRIDRLSVHRRRASARPWSSRRADSLIRRPVVAVLVGGLALAALAAPALDLRLSMPDASTQPRDTSAYAAHGILADGFGAGFDATLSVVVRLPDGDPDRVATAIAAEPGVASVSPPRRSDDGAVALLAVRPTSHLASDVKEMAATSSADCSVNSIGDHHGAARLGADALRREQGIDDT